jgi:hypothetical protein
VFDPATGTFTALSTSMTTPRQAPVAASLPDGRVLIAGGLSPGGDLASAEVFASAPEAAVVGGDFGDQTVAQTSVGETVLVTNVGAQALRIAGVTLAGTDPADFVVSGDNCTGRKLAFG